PCRKRCGFCSRSKRDRAPRRWDRSPRHGGRGAAPPPACCGLTIARPSSARARRCKARTPAIPCGGKMAAELDGPRLEPRAGGAARQLVVFLHGYGADGNDLIEVGRAWQGLLPAAAFVSPHAPRPCGQAPVGREWFPLTFRNPEERWTGVNQAAPVLEKFIDTELKR